MEDVNTSINQHNILNIYRRLYPIKEENESFLSGATLRIYGIIGDYRKGVRQGCILPPCHIKKNAELEEAQMESKLPGEISITSDIQMTPPLWQKVKKN